MAKHNRGTQRSVLKRLEALEGDTPTAERLALARVLACLHGLLPFERLKKGEQAYLKRHREAMRQEHEDAARSHPAQAVIQRERLRLGIADSAPYLADDLIDEAVRLAECDNPSPPCPDGIDWTPAREGDTDTTDSMFDPNDSYFEE